MMRPPGLLIYRWLCVMLTFDLQTAKLTISCPCTMNHLCQLAQNRFVRLQDIVFIYLVTDEHTEGRMDRQTDNMTT